VFYFSTELESVYDAMTPKPSNALVKGIRKMAREHFGDELIRTHSFLGLTPMQQAEMKAITGIYAK
jgi:hypothetical protein